MSAPTSLRAAPVVSFTPPSISIFAFELLLSESDKKRRKANEKEIIKDRHPKMQSEISDRVKSIEDMIKEMTNLLNNTAPI